MRLSVIIANHNYADYVGAAISSALAVDWSDKEVLVVDDASTDSSKEVIEAFSGKVAAYFRPKSNQLGAHMFGFERSTGDVIVFLDADDMLEPSVMQEVAKLWRPGVSKIQYRMNLIDAAGAQLGTAIPQFPPGDDPQKLRRSYLHTMAYTTPPGSGNAYSREFVRDAFGFAATIPQSDAILVTLAPILGDVLTIRKPLGRYRTHRASYSGMPTLDASKLRERLHQDIAKARLFLTAAQQRQLAARADPLRYSLHHLQYRLASYAIDPAAHVFADDTMPHLACRLVAAAATSSQMPLRDRTILIAWTIACALAPRGFRRQCVLWRFSPTTRPRIINAFLGLLSSLRSPRLPDPT
jgi:Glycosyl transferase family 2